MSKGWTPEDVQDHLTVECSWVHTHWKVLVNLHPEKPKATDCGKGGQLLYFEHVLLAPVQTFASSKMESCTCWLEGDLDLFVSPGAWDTISLGSCILAKASHWWMIQISTAYLTRIKKAQQVQNVWESCRSDSWKGRALVFILHPSPFIHPGQGQSMPVSGGYYASPPLPCLTFFSTLL